MFKTQQTTLIVRTACQNPLSTQTSEAILPIMTSISVIVDIVHKVCFTVVVSL